MMKRVWLEEFRRVKGFSHTDLGRMLGITRQAYSLIEAGTRNPSLIVALKLSAILGFEPILFLNKEYSEGKREEIAQ